MKGAEVGRDLRHYLTGAVLSAVLTVVAFGAVMGLALDRPVTLAIVGVAAIAQIVVQLRYFLHIGLDRQKREDLQLILFSVLMLALMAFGTIWIMLNLAGRMH